MYGRHRNGPGNNGYNRSNSMGMGGGLAASPENSVRGNRMYNNNNNSEYRNNNRGGYGRGGGHSKQFQPRSQSPHKVDILVEAGKLAAEYLVSKGVIPSNALLGKWKGDGLKNQMSEVKGFRRVEECDSIGTRGAIERRRSGSFKNYESDTNKESGGINTSSPGEITHEDENAANVESGLEKCDSTASSSSNEKNLGLGGDGEMIERSDDANKIRDNEISSNNDLEQKHEENKESSLASEENVDSLKDLKFENVPTKALSPAMRECSKNENNPMNVDENKSEVSGSQAVDVVDDSSAVVKEQESDHGLSAFGSSICMLDNRSEKRANDDDIDKRASLKKIKEWIPSMDSQSDPCLPLSSSMENRRLSLDPKNATNCRAEEKQLFPGSFKSFDLNLNGTENHYAGTIFPSVTQTGNEVTTPIDVDLSMTKKSNLPNDIEVIDLEDDSSPEDKTFSNLQRREEAVFTDLGGIPTDVQNANEIPEVQDGYGDLMLSELLANDNPNCSSVPTVLNPLQNDNGMSSGEGILGDDDSIYMSLGEIPISFMRAWDQPTQDYSKPF